MSFHETYENKVLNFFIRKEIFALSQLYLGLGAHITDTTLPFLTLEPPIQPSVGYYRIQLNRSYWAPAVAGITSNVVPLGWPIALAYWENVFTHIFISTEAAYPDGEIVCYAALQKPIEIFPGSTPRFKPGDITFTLE